MARQVKNSATSVASTQQPTAAEMRKWYEENRTKLDNYASAEEALRQLVDTSKSTTKTVTAFSKETLRSYLQNIGSNESNLRSLSRYLWHRCQVYKRLIFYNATMFCLNARSLIPSYDLVKGADPEKMKKSFYDTAVVLDKMRIQEEMLKGLITAFREDVFYGCVYYDDTGMFILPLDPDYCKINGAYQSGDFGFAMNMTYFRSRQTQLEYWGEPFTSMYRAYESDTTNGRWQPMPDEYAICLKFGIDDYELAVPPFSGMFNSLIGLVDVEDIQALADEQDIYKLLWVELETITGANRADEWKMNPELVIQYVNRLNEIAMPEWATTVVVPGKLQSTSFEKDQVQDTNKVAKATETVLNSSGGAQILNSATISGTTAFKAAVQADTEFAISTLLPQIQSWVNRFLSYQVSNPCYVKFFEVSCYTIEDFKKSMLQDIQYGLTSKLAINSLNGFSELQSLSIWYLEEEVLGLSQILRPALSSHTMTGDEAGRPIEDDAGDTAEESKEKRDKAKG